MGNFFKKCLPPSNPYIEYVAPVNPVTTTAAPDYKYFLIPSSGTICPPQFLIQGNCNCGSLFISKNFGLNIDTNIIKFTHNQDVLLNNNQAFIASTDKLNIANISDIDIDLFTNVILKNKIQVIVKIKETNKPIAYSVIGNDSQNYTINTINLCLQQPISLNNESLRIEFYSLCYNVDKNDCCDKLPSTITLIDTTTLLPCSTTTTTTTTTLPPFCSRFNLPNLFYATVTAGGELEGQEKVSLFIKNGNIYSTTGTFPCGANYTLSMTCDPITEKFYYNGSIDCCTQSTKIVIDETSRPLIIPGSVLPPIVSYKDCSNCAPPCTTTTTTTTSTTLPPIPCNDEYYGPLTINGYAFYRHSRQQINIPGIGVLTIPCFGGHICNRTNFIPKLITPETTISASPISLNNAPNGQEIDTNFTFSVPDITLLKNGASIKLECETQNCHQGVTWVVLTATINGSTKLLFNSCVLPNEIDDLKYNCEDCCNWDGKEQYIQFSCNDQIYSLPFYKIGSNLFEASTILECGDIVRALFRCNSNISYIDSTSCSQKWEPLSISVPCAINARLTGNVLEPCDCDKPPVYEWVADDLSNCDCCGPPFDIDWQLTWDGMLLGNPWTISNNETSIRFNVEDSSDCGGNNPNTQSGIATATITIGDKNVLMDIDFVGIGELEASGFENIDFYLNGTKIGSAASAGGNLGCEMGQIIKTQQPQQQILLANQIYTFLINFSTNDMYFHVGAYYQVDLTFEEQL